MRFVAIKSEEQQAVLMVHRAIALPSGRPSTELVQDIPRCLE